MNISQLFLERYDPLTRFYYAGIWDVVPQALMRQRPHPRVNAIAWILWHVARVEDCGLNRFVADLPQVLDEGDWAKSMNIPWRSHGSEMTLDEVEELSQKIDLDALHAYHDAVQARTREIVTDLSAIDLTAVMEEERLRRLMIDEGIAHVDPEGFITNYLGWSKCKCLFTYGLTHSFQHLGEIETLATFLGVDWG